MQADMQHRGTAIAPLEMRCERVHQPRQHERQRLEPLDGPFEIERLLEAFFRKRRHERRWILTAREALPVDTVFAEAGRNVIRWQRRQVSQGSQSPAAQRDQQAVRIVRIVRSVRIVLVLIVLVRDAGEERERQRFERRGFVAGFDDRDAGAAVGEQTRGRARAGDGNADAQPAIRGRAAQLGGNRLRIAEEARQSAEIEDDLARAICFDARREITRDAQEDIRQTSFRSIQSGKRIRLLQPSLMTSLRDAETQR